MEPDDVMPNDGQYFLPREPIDQAIDRKRERANTLQDQSELKAHIDRLQRRIEFYEANSSIPDEVRVNPQEFLIMHNSYSAAAVILRAEKEYLEGLIDTNTRNR